MSLKKDLLKIQCRQKIIYVFDVDECKIILTLKYFFNVIFISAHGELIKFDQIL